MWEGEMCHQISIILTHGENDLVRFIVSGVVGSPLEINIELITRTSLVKKIKEGNVTMDIFKVAQKHVYELMKKDSFDKWQKTPEYRKALEKVSKKRGASRSHDRASQSYLPMTTAKSGELKTSKSEDLRRDDSTGTGTGMGSFAEAI